MKNGLCNQILEDPKAYYCMTKKKKKCYTYFVENKTKLILKGFDRNNGFQTFQNNFFRLYAGQK